MKFNLFLYEKTKAIVINIGYIWAICLSAIVQRTTDNINNNLHFIPTVNDPTFRFLSPEEFPPRTVTIQQIETIY